MCKNSVRNKNDRFVHIRCLIWGINICRLWFSHLKSCSMPHFATNPAFLVNFASKSHFLSDKSFDVSISYACEIYIKHKCSYFKRYHMSLVYHLANKGISFVIGLLVCLLQSIKYDKSRDNWYEKFCSFGQRVWYKMLSLLNGKSYINDFSFEWRGIYCALIWYQILCSFNFTIIWKIEKSFPYPLNFHGV